MSKAKMLAAPPPVVIDETNLSRGWARLLLQVLDGAATEVAPSILSLSGFAQNGAAVEDPGVRQALDLLLKRKGRLVVKTSRSRSSRSDSRRCRVATGPAFLHSIARRSRAGRR